MIAAKRTTQACLLMCSCFFCFLHILRAPTSPCLPAGRPNVARRKRALFYRKMHVSSSSHAFHQQNTALTRLCVERHKMNEMPRWLSSAKMEIVKSLLADDPGMLLRESMGISADDSTRAFPSDDVEAFFKRKPVTMKRDLSEFYSSRNCNHFILAVDPSGGGASQFACASIAQQSNGMVVVRHLGQFPSLSPAHISDSTALSATSWSGR